MMVARNLTLAEINNEAIRVLCEKLGVANTLQFLGQYRKGSGDYSRDRDSLFPQKTVDELYAEIKAWQDKNLTTQVPPTNPST